MIGYAINKSDNIITESDLLRAGYKEYPSWILTCKRIFQRSVSDDNGRLYFITFREWHQEGRITYDAEMAFVTDTDGHLWITIREKDIATVESRAEQLWTCGGGVRYEYESC